MLQRKYGLFTERGLALYASAAAIAYLSGLASLLLRHIPIFSNDNCRDFVWIWLSGRFAASSAPVHVYDYSAFAAAKDALLGPPACILEHFDYPPTLLFFVYPLSFLPYTIAFTAWVAITLVIYLAVVYIIIPHRNALLVASTVFPVWFNVLLGHDGFLTAAFLGLALIFIETRPWLAGLFLALLTYKPQFGILFPAALTVSRCWRTLSAAVVASAIFAVMAAVAFGFETWPAFVHALTDRVSAIGADHDQARPLVSIGFLMSRGWSTDTVWAVQLLISAVAAVTVCLIWARSFPYSLKAAALAFGSVIASPHVLRYDLCILTIGAAFFIKDGLSRGFLPGERAMLLLCWAGLFLRSGPTPLIISLALLALVVGRVMRFKYREVVRVSADPVPSNPLPAVQAPRQ